MILDATSTTAKVEIENRKEVYKVDFEEFEGFTLVYAQITS